MVAVTDVLTVHGGTPLAGVIAVRGAKNFVSKAMVAALLGEEPSRLLNVPQIRDVTVEHFVGDAVGGGFDGGGFERSAVRIGHGAFDLDEGGCRVRCRGR